MKQNTSGTPVLEIRDLSLSYGDSDIVRHASLSIMPGEIVCIAGESGCGKSTLLKAIHGMDAVNVTGGEIYFNGSSLTDMSRKERRLLMGTGIGLIPQNPQGSFNPLRTFEKQMRETMSSHGLAFDPDEMISLMDSMGLEDGMKLLKSRPYELSGGMNQRVAIVFSLLLKPRVLLCDEITSALDVTNGKLVISEVESYAARSGAALLMVTHHLGIADRIADTVAVMKFGEIVEYGSTSQVLYHPQDSYTRMLLEKIPRVRREEW
ncbi:MAG: ABC transporter ATP-binding protein [Lachnospiraceae bacterium]|nr:ABC transporter ATP-binding protein [Lachnospiraceae bacterium]